MFRRGEFHDLFDEVVVVRLLGGKDASTDPAEGTLRFERRYDPPRDPVWGSIPISLFPASYILTPEGECAYRWYGGLDYEGFKVEFTRGFGHAREIINPMPLWTRFERADFAGFLTAAESVIPDAQLVEGKILALQGLGRGEEARRVLDVELSQLDIGRRQGGVAWTRLQILRVVLEDEEELLRHLVHFAPSKALEVARKRAAGLERLLGDLEAPGKERLSAKAIVRGSLVCLLTGIEEGARWHADQLVRAKKHDEAKRFEAKVKAARKDAYGHASWILRHRSVLEGPASESGPSLDLLMAFGWASLYDRSPDHDTVEHIRSSLHRYVDPPASSGAAFPDPAEIEGAQAPEQPPYVTGAIWGLLSRMSES